MPDAHALVDMLRSAYATWGYPIVFLGAMLENTVLLGLILPGGAVVVMGAVYAQEGSLSLPLVLIAAWLGMVVGTSTDYMLGRLGIHRALERSRYGPRLTSHLEAAERHLNRYGLWAFLIAHFVGHIRSFVAITAGVTHLPWHRFLTYEGIAALVWNVIFLGIGYLLGENIQLLQQIISRVGLAAFAVAFATYLVYRVYKRRGRQSAAGRASESSTHAVTAPNAATGSD